jgi:hypothetical protein
MLSRWKPAVITLVVSPGADCKGAEAFRELADKVQARADEIWQQGHIPMIARHPELSADMNALADAAEAELTPAARRANPDQAKPRRSGLTMLSGQGIRLRPLPNWMTLCANSRQYTQQRCCGLRAPGNQGEAGDGAGGAGADRQPPPRRGEQGVRDVNMRWGSLNSIRDRLEERAVQLGLQEAKKGPIPDWLHVYSFLHPGAASIPGMVALGAHILRSYALKKDYASKACGDRCATSNKGRDDSQRRAASANSSDTKVLASDKSGSFRSRIRIKKTSTLWINSV